MTTEKRTRARAIIIKNNQLLTMYREREDRIFYTFPGGGQENNETLEQCVIREVEEEYGIKIAPIKQVYIYENKNNIEHFFVCNWISGEFGTGIGEEYQANNTNGKYIPMMIDINKIPLIPLMPPEITKFFYEDYKKFGKELDSKIKTVVVE